MSVAETDNEFIVRCADIYILFASIQKYKCIFYRKETLESIIDMFYTSITYIFKAWSTRYTVFHIRYEYMAIVIQISSIHDTNWQPQIIQHSPNLSFIFQFGGPTKTMKIVKIQIDWGCFIHFAEKKNWFLLFLILKHMLIQIQLT